MILWLLFTLSQVLSKEDDVHALTEDNFDDFLKENERVLVEFYAPWCGHCKNLAPEYAKAATGLKEAEAITKLVKVDATEAKELALKYSVQGFPTLKYFHNGEVSEYGGGRTEETIISWIKKREMPAVSVVENAAALDKLKESESIVAVAFVESGNEAQIEAVKQLADKFRDDLVTGQVESKTLAAEVDATVPSVILYGSKVENAEVKMEGDFTLENMISFFQNERFPILDQIGPENYKLYMDRDIPVVWLSVDTDNDEARDAVKVEAKKYKGALSFVWVDAAKFKQHVEGNLGIKSNPGVMIINGSNNKKYSFDGEIKNAEVLAKFFSDWKDGVLEPFLKSQDVPATNDGAVTVVVGKNFEELVMDSSKNVFIEYYAPWCGHCKKLAPIWEDLGEKFKDDERVRIAKCDATENDTQDKVEGFPTLYFYGLDNKGEKYDGGRNIEDLTEFIEKKLPSDTSETENAEGQTAEDGEHTEL